MKNFLLFLILSLPASAAPAAAPDLNEFVARYRAAFEKADQGALKALYLVDGPEAETGFQKEMYTLGLVMKSKLTSVKAVKAAPQPAYPDAKFQPNLPREWDMEISFIGKDGPDSTMLPFALKDGVYMMAVWVPVPSAKAAKRPAPVKIAPKRDAPPEPDPKLERLEAFCANEIGLLCKSKKTKAKALTACLKDHWDNLLPACRTALRSGD